MNIIDKFYFSMINSGTSKIKIITGLLFLAIGVVGLLASFMEPTKNFLFDNLRSTGFMIFGIALLLSSANVLSSWNIGDERFPVGLRKYIIILFELFGFLFIAIGYIYIFLIK
jgi:hypothetical protein